jgi:hypothetical protein
MFNFAFLGHISVSTDIIIYLHCAAIRLKIDYSVWALNNIQGELLC